MRKRYWIVLVYGCLAVAFFLVVEPLAEIIADWVDPAPEPALLRWLYRPLGAIAYVVSLIFGFFVLTTLVSMFFYLHYRKKENQEMKTGFAIVSLIGLAGLLFILAGAIFG